MAKPAVCIPKGALEITIYNNSSVGHCYCLDLFTFAADESSSAVSNASSGLDQKFGCSISVAYLHSTADTSGFRHQPHFRIPTPSSIMFYLYFPHTDVQSEYGLLLAPLLCVARHLT